jgi:DNA adenine methylase
LRGKYYEPFLGGGAVFFALRPNRAVLSDINAELIVTYQQVQTRPAELTQAVRLLKVSSKDYRRVRISKPQRPLDVAARFLYLNRTAFAGMYRLNRNGEFNVPYGGGERTPAILWERNLLQQASLMLRKATVLKNDFQHALMAAESGDVVYCDPTYTVTHDNNCFRRYNEAVFSWQDQERLRDLAFGAAKRGATVLVSNAFHQDVAQLYRSQEKNVCIDTTQLTRVSCVPTEPKHRRLIREYLFAIRKRN